MHKLEQLSIVWNYDNDELLSIAKSSDSVLQDFFSMKDWNFIRNCFEDIYNEVDTQYNEKSIVFSHDLIYLHVNDNVSEIEKHECLKSFIWLYDLMIMGANDDHHSVRYEPWWQEFTEVFYQLKCKLEIQEQLKKEFNEI